MPKKSPDLVDLESILERTIWSLKQTPEQLMAHIRVNRTDVFHTIPDPKTGGKLIIGSDGTDRFWAIARRHLASISARKRRTSLPAFVEQLRVEFSQLFLAEGAKADQPSVDQWINRAYAAIAEEYKATTHYIPCAFLDPANVRSFEVGPVTFLHKAEFSRLYGQEIDKLPESIRVRHREFVAGMIEKGFPAENAATPEQSERLGHRMTDGLRDFFDCYNWYAVVMVDAADADVSYDRALFATRGALNIIKVLIGSYHTDRLRTANDPGSASKGARLTRDAKGEFEISLSTAAVDNVGVECWHEFLSKDERFTLLARALSHCSTFEDPPHLCHRLMDAVTWFGDAVAEKSPAAKIVKFVNAIERICGTDKEFVEKDGEKKERGVTDIVLTRSSILYSIITGKTFKAAKTEIEETYKCRSKLVHGSLSPFADDVTEQLHKTDRLTGILLLAAVDYFEGLGLEDRTIDENKLREAFLQLEKWQKDGRPDPSKLRQEGLEKTPDCRTE